MTDAKLKAYNARLKWAYDACGWDDDWSDPTWAAECLRDCQRMAEAETAEEAASVLSAWGYRVDKELYVQDAEEFRQRVREGGLPASDPEADGAREWKARLRLVEGAFRAGWEACHQHDAETQAALGLAEPLEQVDCCAAALEAAVSELPALLASLEA